jgi:hypothetical protein
MDPRRPARAPTIPFARSPAAVTLGEAMGLAARYWSASWDRWLLAVIAVGLSSGLAELLLGSSSIDQRALTEALGPGGSLDAVAVPALLAGPLAVALVSLVADWFLYANAILGLRGGQLSLRRVLGAGLRVLLVALLVAPAALLLVSLLAALGPVGLVVALGLVPAAFYVGLRLQLWTIGVFDGRGIADAVSTSWSLTRGAVLRVLGWFLALVGLSLGVGALAGAVGLVLLSVPAIPAAVTAAASTAFQAWSVVVMAILYERQRLRSIEGPPASGWAPPAAVPPGWGRPPDDRGGNGSPPPPPGP